MKNATIMLLIDRKRKKILLGMKKKGFGAGRYNGFGGKVEPGEEIKDAAIREMFEESSITVLPKQAEKYAEIDFFFESKSEWDQKVHVFVAEKWSGEPFESDEMIPEWFSFSKIPFDRMWVDDIHWLPKVLDRKKVKAEFIFPKGDENKILGMKLRDLDGNKGF
jgi:8-oxo-dGTP pyrophosphatase MutT (NUDIX family)